MKRLLKPFTLLLFLQSTLFSQQQFSDCASAWIVCDKSTVTVESIADAGANGKEINATACYDKNFPETNTIWFKWKIATSGNIGFTLIPIDEKDDLDFVLFALKNELNDCEAKEELRCMASGENLGEAEGSENHCTGATGLRAGVFDISEDAGCNENNDNFLSTISAQAGETYLLFVNNFHSSKGFLLEFIGDAEFENFGDLCTGNPVSTVHALEKGVKITDVFPNPAADELFVSLQTEKPLQGTAVIIDVGGNVQTVQEFSVINGENRLVIKTGALSRGNYFVKLKLGNGTYLTKFSKI